MVNDNIVGCETVTHDITPAMLHHLQVALIHLSKSLVRKTSSWG